MQVNSWLRSAYTGVSFKSCCVELIAVCKLQSEVLTT